MTPDMTMKPGVQRLCQGIESLPEEDQAYLVFCACSAVGLEPSDASQPRLTANDLRLRLVYLVDEQKLWPPFLVPGLLSYLIQLWRVFADVDRMIKPGDSLLPFDSISEPRPKWNPHEQQQAARVLDMLEQLQQQELNAEFWQRYVQSVKPS